MDVLQHNFSSKLLDILTAVSRSHFVAFDLELSGVPVRPYGSQRAGKQTLQQRYAEIRLAAQKYTILQLGLTCVTQDAAQGIYELKPFNINLSPLLTERIDIDRDFTFHSGAVDFLNSVGFNFQAPLTIGVPYLSREEAALAKERAQERLSRPKDHFQPMDIKPDELEALALQKRINTLVKTWITRVGSGPGEGLWLGPEDLSTVKPPPEELSRFEKRLVHQIVRSDFEKLVTFPRRGGIEVQHLDQEREDAFKRLELRKTKERISRQRGLGWVIEAIAGRSFGDLDWRSLTVCNAEGLVTASTPDIQARFQGCQQLLQDKPRPVVGHNMFLDLVYLYQTFIGQLPEKVEDFAHEINDLFPVVVDTKYVGTHECGDLNPMSSLQQIAEQMDQQEEPVISTHAEFNKYDGYVAHHEAGYDSLLTAKIAIRLSAKLEADKMLVAEANEAASESTSEDEGPGGVAINTESTLTSALDTVKSKFMVPVVEAVARLNGTSKKPQANETSRFAHRTAFDGLQDDEDKDDAVEAEEVLDFDDLPTEGAYDGWGKAGAKSNHHGVSRQQEWIPRRLMPAWTADFWQEYGNRLRVFGTQESICVLAPGIDRPKAEDGEPLAKDRDEKPVTW